MVEVFEILKVIDMIECGDRRSRGRGHTIQMHDKQTKGDIRENIKLHSESLGLENMAVGNGGGRLNGLWINDQKERITKPCGDEPGGLLFPGAFKSLMGLYILCDPMGQVSRSHCKEHSSGFIIF